jgi:hypothetical protein
VTVVDVRKRVSGIRRAAAEHDSESAHGQADNLMLDALAAIATGVSDPARLAAEVLKIEKIDFEWWCA